ncbi:MAG TPA: sigma-70 family RNA polymerase sigma factor [Bacteroidetes bacterium]|nr:sigma-70 family RNA polymerase sigma factor [Bacteroidota bacterium]
MDGKKPSICKEKTFTAIFKEYSETLHNYLFYKTGNAGLSKDLTQEAFAKLWQNCKSVMYDTAKGYVFKIANNLLLNEYAHQKVVLNFQKKPVIAHTNESPEHILEQKELKAQIEAAISALPEKQRTVFLMSRIDKKTYKEIAELLGISKQAVEKRMYNALDALRLVSKKIR